MTLRNLPKAPQPVGGVARIQTEVVMTLTSAGFFSVTTPPHSPKKARGVPGARPVPREPVLSLARAEIEPSPFTPEGGVAGPRRGRTVLSPDAETSCQALNLHRALTGLTGGVSKLLDFPAPLFTCL